MSTQIQPFNDYKEIQINKNKWFLIKNIDLIAKDRLPTFFGCVYILQYKSGKIKIGKTGNPFERIKGIINHSRIYSSDSFCVVKILISQPHTNYGQNEKLLHNFFQELHHDGEIFSISLSKAINELQNFNLSFEDKSYELSRKSKESSDRIIALIKNPQQLKHSITQPNSKYELDIMLKKGYELVVKYVSMITQKEINGNILTSSEEMYMQKVFLATNELIESRNDDLRSKIRQQENEIRQKNKIINLYNNGIFYKQ